MLKIGSLKSALRQNGKVRSLCWRANREVNSIKYFTAKENSNVRKLDGNISWCRYIFGDLGVPRQNGRFCTVRIRFDSIRIKMAATVGTRYISKHRKDNKRKEPGNDVGQLIVPYPLIFIGQGMKNLYFSKLRGLFENCRQRLFSVCYNHLKLRS